MLELSRSIRFCLRPGAGPAQALRGSRYNSFAGWPTMHGVGVFYELVVRCRRPVDPLSGFMMSIADIDAAAREAIPLVAEALQDPRPGDPAPLLRRIAAQLQERLAQSLSSVTWRLSPYYSLTVESADMERVRVAQQFEFAASHRLHCPALSAEENRRLFGKCNNPSGHGHNYRLQVVMARPVDRATPTLEQLERIVHDEVVARFDHVHLNLDTAEFSDRNPSIEHITRVCFELLAGPVAAAGGDLEEVTVWETEKTSCTYRPEPAG